MNQQQQQNHHLRMNSNPFFQIATHMQSDWNIKTEWKWYTDEQTDIQTDEHIIISNSDFLLTCRCRGIIHISGSLPSSWLSKICHYRFCETNLFFIAPGGKEASSFHLQGCGRNLLSCGKCIIAPDKLSSFRIGNDSFLFITWRHMWKWYNAIY